MPNAKGRLAEAYTGSSTSKTTDLGFGYSARGDVTDSYESTPHSGGYYHVAATYWANGLLKTLSTGRTTYYQYEINGYYDFDTLTWNANGTLQGISIYDEFIPNSSQNDSQVCTNTYDDLGRLASNNCGNAWAQTFTYDAFGNISFTGWDAFQPTYTPGNSGNSGTGNWGGTGGRSTRLLVSQSGRKIEPPELPNFLCECVDQYGQKGSVDELGRVPRNNIAYACVTADAAAITKRRSARNPSWTPNRCVTTRCPRHAVL